MNQQLRALVVLMFIPMISGCADQDPAAQIVSDAAAALGGRARLEAIKTLAMEGAGSNGNLGQDMTPEATAQTFTVTGYKRTVDLTGGRVRIEQTRTPDFVYFQGQQAQKQVLGLDGDVAYNVGANGTATRASEAVAADRRAELYHHPITIVRAALNPAATLSNPRTQDNQRVVDVTTADGGLFTLAIDAGTKLPSRVVSMTDNTNLGDVAIETSFADYQEIDGVKLPARLTTRSDTYTVADLRIAQQRLDGEAADLAAPSAAASAPAPPPVPPAAVTVQEVAPGVWWLAGQSHHSVLLEFADHMTLVEVPQNDVRALAVIARAREIRPDKPLTHAVLSHHHFDHSGGIRAAVSEGLTLVAQKNSAQYLRDAAGRAHTIVPDALAKNPKPVKIEVVDEELELKDAARTVNLYRIADSPHADTLLMAYLPKERIIIEADVYNPGTTAIPFAANFLDNVTKRRLRVDRIVPLHGTIGAFTDLTKAVQQLKATN